MDARTSPQGFRAIATLHNGNHRPFLFSGGAPLGRLLPLILGLISYRNIVKLAGGWRSGPLVRRAIKPYPSPAGAIVPLVAVPVRQAR